MDNNKWCNNTNDNNRIKRTPVLTDTDFICMMTMMMRSRLDVSTWMQPLLLVPTEEDEREMKEEEAVVVVMIVVVSPYIPVAWCRRRLHMEGEGTHLHLSLPKPLPWPLPKPSPMPMQMLRQ